MSDKAKTLTFAALSDLHQNGDPASLAGRKWQSALAQLRERYSLDLMLIAGDLTDCGSEAQLWQFACALDVVYPDLPVVCCAGNHDGQNGSAAEKIADVLGKRRLKYDLPSSDSLHGNRHAVLGGYHFIAVETENYYLPGGECTVSEMTLQWLRKALAEAAEDCPEKHIFLAAHPMVFKTAYGSDLPSTGTNWYTKALTPLLEQYPQAVIFGGHVHHPLNDERSVMQKSFTAFGCGSVSYLAIEGGYTQTGNGTVPCDATEFSQGLVGTVFPDGKLRVDRLDFYHRDLIGEPWVIPPPTDIRHLNAYTEKRADTTPAPAFSPDAELSCTKDEAGNLTLAFSAAKSGGMTHHYEIYVRGTDGTEQLLCRTLSDFYRAPHFAQMQEKQMLMLRKDEISSLEIAGVKAVGSWGKKSALLKLREEKI